MENRTRKKIIIWAIILVMFLLLYKKCSVDEQSRDRHTATTKICNNLYVESFCVFGQGAFGTDLKSKWLTDSTNFRVYLGTYDEGGGYVYISCKGDSVFVTKKISETDLVEISITYKISELQKKHNLNEY